MRAPHVFRGRETKSEYVNKVCLSVFVEIDYQLDLGGCQYLFENNSHLVLLVSFAVISVH
ncbi:hypothetical protein N476_06630 [Pseudoalteromonas luteoviolacea H33]|uniref:Uncharacterized protein n=1 Tax=Pseudoalteromonas luteoviolacea H33 TaxID=1365251 RepID=A0A167GQQ7_9GAMM|nr:hypothetical protein N476_06630 [Pseudoalteromonas luteoviolacea H33]KZN77004.1 hypothetical protein N477_13585 [Pseudoalteromonas luteoviolacea H33-S]